MAFTIANWTCVSPSLNEGQLTVTPFGGSPTVLNAPNAFMYGSPNDTAAQIGAANYFLAQYKSLSVGDWIMGFGTDASFIYQVTAVSSTSVTVVTTGAMTSVGTANIINNAVTYAKIQQETASTLLGNPTGGTANVSEITLGNGLAFTGTTLGLPNNTLRYISVPMTLAQFTGMNATPFQVLAAPGAGLMHIIDSVAVNIVYGGTSITGGGNVGFQYGNTAALAGPAASATEAATDYTSAAASRMCRFSGGLGTGVATSTALNTAVFISNATAAFAGGTGSTFTVNIWYKTVSAS